MWFLSESISILRLSYVQSTDLIVLFLLMEIMHWKLYALGIKLLKHLVNGIVVFLSVLPEYLPTHPNYSQSLAYQIQCHQTTDSTIRKKIIYLMPKVSLGSLSRILVLLGCHIHSSKTVSISSYLLWTAAQHIQLVFKGKWKYSPHVVILPFCGTL